MASPLPLETPRLILRRFRTGDLDAFLAYRNHPDVVLYQSWTQWSHEQGVSFIREQQAVDPGDFGRWFQFALELKETGALVGDCGICIKVAVPKTAEVGFSLVPAHQGRGFAQEAVGRVLDHAFRHLAVERTLAIVMTGNERSVTLLRRLGFRPGDPMRVWFKSGWTEEIRFSLDRAGWLARTGG